MRTIKLRDIASPISINISNPSDCGYDKFVGLEHYDSGEFVISRYSGVKLLTSAAKEFRKNDILIARRNVYLKRAGIVKFDGITSGDSIILRVNEHTIDTVGLSREIIEDYLPLVLNTEDFWLYANKHADGMNSKRISKDTLLDYEFMLPSEIEIKTISEKAWAAYRLKEAYKHLLAATDEMVKSQFIELFGNPLFSDKADAVSVREAVEIILGSTPNSKEERYWNGNLCWITPAELSDDSFEVGETERHISEEGAKSANLTLMPKGTVLLSTRAPIGKVALITTPMFCNQGFKNMICTSGLNNVFLYYTLKYNRGKLQSMGTGTTFKELSKKVVESIKISIPDIKLQMKFEGIYRQADKSKFELKKAIEAIDQVIKSLING